MASPHYHVRMRMGDGSGNTCWHTSVPLRQREVLPCSEIERRARIIAVKAFGPQAAGWTLLDAERRTR